MKIIKNESLQGHMIFFRTPTGAQGFWMTPGEQMVVPSTYISDHVTALLTRRILSVTDA